MKASELSWRNVNHTGAIADLAMRHLTNTRINSRVGAFVRRRCVFLSLVVVLILSPNILPTSFTQEGSVQSQKKPASRSGSHSSRDRAGMTPEMRASIEQAMGVICTEQKLDPKASVPIDHMQARPSLPVQNPEAQEGLARAQRVLPIAKSLVMSALQQLAAEYDFQKSRRNRSKIQQAVNRVQAVRRIKPDVESRDNASVFLSRPQTITFGTIFLAGLRSDEGMISVLSHELMHIADGDADTLRALVAAVSLRAANLTGLEIHGQRGEELTCDLIGAMAVRRYVLDSPSYESIARRLARSVQHNCVEIDEGDDDHLSPRNTIRALLAINPTLVRELLDDRHESPKNH